MAPAPVVSDPYGHPHPQDIRTPPHERMVVAVVPARRSSLLQPAVHRAGVVLGLFFLFLHSALASSDLGPTFSALSK